MLATLLALALAAQPPAAPAPQAPAAATATATFGPQSTFDVMVKDARARAILDKHIPLIMQVFDSGAFPGVATLEQVSQDGSAQSGGGFTAEAYKAILADFAKL